MNNQGNHYHQSFNADTGRDDNGNAVPNPESGDVDEVNTPNFGLPVNGLPQFPVTNTNITTTTTTTTTTDRWDIFGEIPILPVPSSVETSLSPAQQQQHQQQQISPALDSSREPQSRSRKRLKSNSPNSGASSSSVRKRTLTACESCRIKKIKCDLNKPTCTNCVKFSMNCIYRQTNIEPVVQPTPIPVPAQDQSDSANMDKREEAMRDLANSSVLSSERGTMTSLMGNSNWLVNIENLITWDVYSQFNSTHNLRSINTRLVLYSGFHGYDLQQGLFTEEGLSSMSSDLLNNFDTYVSNYSKFVQDKNPFIDLEKLKYTVQFIKDSQSLDIFKLNFDSEMIPLPSILLICSCSLLSRPFDVRSQQQQQQQQQTFRTSKEEKGANFAKSLAYFQLANQLQASVSHRIQDFDLNIIQFYLLSSTFLMLNMKPMQTWDLIHRSSIRIITILESLKSSSQKFSQRDFKNIERFFFTCFKYESELRVELSPLVPSSGIIHYPFPALYPTVPPISGRSIEEQTSWFYYLTELSLRKLENRILDVFYTIDSSSVNNEKEGEFVSDNYDLNWDKKWTLMSAIAKGAEFLADVKKIEVQMLLFLKPALSQLDQDSLAEILKPHGFVLKDFLNESDLKKLEKRKKQKSPKTPDSGGSTTAESTAGNTPKEGVSDVPEVLNYIKTRMLVLKALLFRPILYHVYKMNRVEILAALANNTFLKNLIQQGVDSWDHLDVSLAKHRHYGSWFFLRHLVSISTLFYGLFIKLRNELMDVEKVKEGFVTVIDILNYWIDECPEFKESIDLMNEFLEDIDKMD
ncbi:hypothetical protein WICPIJ_005080 [Wickerhamomyces pijperi]|uniref:Zn(2)-C6 fungal-type domain-containing protein n=1 Tax=Wickerhamomyces pijperi TaxID=599730 RepID=A0A9P8Q4R0_WICPI|nr:hypothetical protein WICPIJ_005080 [Wickerhamomyces pijperi]